MHSSSAPWVLHALPISSFLVFFIHSTTSPTETSYGYDKTESFRRFGGLPTLLFPFLKIFSSEVRRWCNSEEVQGCFRRRYCFYLQGIWHVKQDSAISRQQFLLYVMLLWNILEPEDGGSASLRNFGQHLPVFNGVTFQKMVLFSVNSNPKILTYYSDSWFLPVDL
jgi:hypothetical protein